MYVPKEIAGQMKEKYIYHFLARHRLPVRREILEGCVTWKYKLFGNCLAMCSLHCPSLEGKKCYCMFKKVVWIQYFKNSNAAVLDNNLWLLVEKWKLLLKVAEVTLWLKECFVTVAKRKICPSFLSSQYAESGMQTMKAEMQMKIQGWFISWKPITLFQSLLFFSVPHTGFGNNLSQVIVSSSMWMKTIRNKHLNREIN